MMKVQALLTLLFLTLLSATVSAEDERLKRLDEIFREWSQSGTPGAAVTVIQAGKIVIERGYGSANLEYSIPVTPQTVCHVASVFDLRANSRG